MFRLLPRPHFPVIWPAFPWKASQGGVTQLPLELKEEMSRSSDFLSPAITFPGWREEQEGCAQTSFSLSPKQATYQTPKWQFLILHDVLANSDALLLAFSASATCFPHLQVWEGWEWGFSRDTGHDSSLWKAIDFIWGARENTRVRPASIWWVGGSQASSTVPTCIAEGASGQSQGGPETLATPTCVSLCLMCGGSRCRNMSVGTDSRRPVLPGFSTACLHPNQHSPLNKNRGVW